MANRKATLVRCAKIPKVGWRRGTLIRTKNGRVKPDYMVYNGEQVHCPQGKYEIRYYDGSKTLHKPVGSDLDVSLTAFSLFEKKLQYEALQQDLGIKMPELREVERKTLSKLGALYIEKYAHGSDSTIRKYTFVGKEFAEFLTKRQKVYPDEVTEDDVVAFDRALELRGDCKSTRSDRYGLVRCFLRYIGLDPNRVVSPEWNQKMKKKPKLALSS